MFSSKYFYVLRKFDNQDCGYKLNISTCELVKTQATVSCNREKIATSCCWACLKPALRFLIVISGKVANAVLRNKLRRWTKNLLFGSKELFETFEKTGAHYAFVFKPAAKQLVLNIKGFELLRGLFTQLTRKL